MSIKKQYYTIKEASVYLAITESALRNMIYRREIEFLKLGNRIRFTTSQLDSPFITYKSISQIQNEGEIICPQ